jgi:Flp pilus assembly protein TadG
MKSHHTGKRAARGQVLAEFAVVSLALLLMVFGILDCGRALYFFHLVSDAARIGTRYAIVNGSLACPSATQPSPDPLQAYVVSQSPGVTASAMTVTTTCTDTADCTPTAAPYNVAGCLVTVKVAYTFRFLVPLVSKLVVPMASQSQMVISGG